ncbi:hypothetical protein QBK93_07645 [Rhizobium leguminosarum]|uniref:hypothetical protein n=1 Tax=Rhizobium leguminosarum TaxID=384 RepID=UPI0024A8F8D9|nr:hypothetical protein [Rhizobium leguminosarum]MDI5924553.1 hypothetical protein [Rhizobium leguminosarum]
MINKRKLTAIAAFLLPVSMTVPCHADTVNPVDVIATLHDAIRLAIDPRMSSTHWLSLSTVGAVAEADDKSIVNDFANFCPPSSPVIDSYNRVRKLDGIYEDILRGMTGPSRPPTRSFTDAQAVLINTATRERTPEYKKYGEYLTRYAETLKKYFEATNDSEKLLRSAELQALGQDWVILGSKNEVDAALWQIELAATKFGAAKNGHRQQILAAFRTAGMRPTDGVASYRAPVSEFSPDVSAWNNETGWTSFSFTKYDFSRMYSAESSRNHGFGGINVGFAVIGGSGGGGDGTVTQVTSTSDFKYEFELKRVEIRRPWLDAEVFFQPLGWTWKKSANTVAFPHVGDGADTDGKPKEPTSAVYDNNEVGCTLMPLEFIIARKRSVTATMSTTDYQRITRSGSSGGGGGLFGIIGGGGSHSWSSTKINDSNGNTTFKVDSPSIGIIGVISEIIPTLPNPNVADTWPDDAWLERDQ